MSFSNIAMGIAGVCIGFGVCYWILTSSKKQTPVNVPKNTGKTDNPSGIKIRSWCNDYMKNYRKKLLGFYVNEEMREHFERLTSEDEKKLREKYGQVYSVPVLYDIYMDFGKDFPILDENALEDAMQDWLNANYEESSGSYTGRKLTETITAAIEPQVKHEAGKILEDISKQK